MCDARTILCKTITEQVTETFNGQIRIFKNKIPSTVKKLAELPEEDQDLYRLYFTEGYSQEEIAKMKGVSQNTISKKLRRIQKTLTEMCRNEV